MNDPLWYSGRKFDCLVHKSWPSDHIFGTCSNVLLLQTVLFCRPANLDKSCHCLVCGLVWFSLSRLSIVFSSHFSVQFWIKEWNEFENPQKKHCLKNFAHRLLVRISLCLNQLVRQINILNFGLFILGGLVSKPSFRTWFSSLTRLVRISSAIPQFIILEILLTWSFICFGCRHFCTSILVSSDVWFLFSSLGYMRMTFVLACSFWDLPVLAIEAYYDIVGC